MISLLLRLKRFLGILFGIVYFLSGLIKLMDPVGAGLVMKEYFDFMHLGFMEPAAKIFGAAFALAETLVGAALVCGVWRRYVGKIAIALQSIFTLLTLFLYICNPEMDCGCFGEAIHLTHSQTFFKNIVLLAMILAYYIPSKHLGETTRRKYVSFFIVSISSVAFMIYSLMYIPLVDFTAYKPGAELLSNASDGGDELYEAVFTYEKDGKSSTFTLEELPEDIDTWTYVGTDTRIKKDIAGSIVELSIFDPKSQKYVDSIAADGKALIVSIYDTDIKAATWEKIESLAAEAKECGMKVAILATDTVNLPESLQNSAYTSDFKTLISLNRSNGGATYFNDGILIKKWAERVLPSADEIKEITAADPTEVVIDYQSKGSLGFQGFLLYVFAVMLLL